MWCCALCSLPRIRWYRSTSSLLLASIILLEGIRVLAHFLDHFLVHILVRRHTVIRGCMVVSILASGCGDGDSATVTLMLISVLLATPLSFWWSHCQRAEM
ncbi:hypothetical protein F4814DRAFT_419322 [Daldinia grandis]|nr:hypothetical protein F4814DRAFT_419322 [Daldinia grandis]